MERSFPRTVALICTLALAGAAVAPVAHADDLKKKRKRVQHSIKVASSDLEDSSSQLVAATKRLQSAQAQLGAAQRVLAQTEGQLTAARVLDQQMQARLAQAEQELHDAEAALAAGVQAVKDQRAELGRMVAASYSSGDPRLMGLSVVFSADDPADIANQLSTMDSVLDREAGLLDKLKATRAMLETQREKVDRARDAVAEQRKAAAANLVRRQALERAAVQHRAEVARLVTAQAQAYAAARAARASDLRRLRLLQREDARIKRMILARARKQKGGYVGDTGSFLMRPVPGYVTSPFGWRRHPIYGYWGLHNGVDFHAPCGTPMHAAGTGTVISEYYSSVWGNRLFLDVGRANGHNVTVVYNHISRYAAHTGQRVGRGSVVAYAGTTGWSTACHLHFTVLLDGNPVNPMTFF